MGVWQTIGHIQIMTKIANPTQEPPVSLRIQNEDLKDMDVFCTFKTMMKSQKQKHQCIEPPAPNNATNKDLKDIDVLCTFKFKIESWNLEYGCIKDQWPYPNQDQDA